MGFQKYKISNWLQHYDLPAEGAAATIKEATRDLQENFRTKEKEMRVTLSFHEFKPMTLTNINLDALDECYPEDDLETIVGKRIWLKPMEIEAFGEAKTVVRIDKNRTFRMQPDPSQPEKSESPKGDPVHDDEPPPHTDADAGPPAEDDEIPF